MTPAQRAYENLSFWQKVRLHLSRDYAGFALRTERDDLLGEIDRLTGENAELLALNVNQAARMTDLHLDALASTEAGDWEALIAERDDLRRQLQIANEGNAALQAMVDSCREVVAENNGDFDGERPIDHITMIVGYPPPFRMTRYDDLLSRLGRMAVDGQIDPSDRDVIRQASVRIRRLAATTNELSAHFGRMADGARATAPERLSMSDPTAERLWRVARVVERDPDIAGRSAGSLAAWEFEEWEYLTRKVAGSLGEPVSFAEESAVAALTVALRAARESAHRERG